MDDLIYITKYIGIFRKAILSREKTIRRLYVTDSSKRMVFFLDSNLDDYFKRKLHTLLLFRLK